MPVRYWQAWAGGTFPVQDFEDIPIAFWQSRRAPLPIRRRLVLHRVPQGAFANYLLWGNLLTCPAIDLWRLVYRKADKYLNPIALQEWECEVNADATFLSERVY
jgi:hypothetical protein